MIEIFSDYVYTDFLQKDNLMANKCCDLGFVHGIEIRPGGIHPKSWRGKTPDSWEPEELDANWRPVPSSISQCWNLENIPEIVINSCCLHLSVADVGTWRQLP